MSDTDYKPIACALHDHYEIAIMHKQVMHIVWQDETGDRHEADVLPVDIRVADGEEFLVVKPVDVELGSESLEIRLDRIASAKSVS